MHYFPSKIDQPAAPQQQSRAPRKLDPQSDWLWAKNPESFWGQAEADGNRPPPSAAISTASPAPQPPPAAPARVLLTPAALPDTGTAPRPALIRLRAGPDAVLLGQARALLAGVGCSELAAKVRIIWNPRMRSTAGTAIPAKALVKLNSRLETFGPEEVDRTLRHELAHLLAFHRAGRRRIEPHGPEWRAACQELGLADESRCHTLPLPHRKLTARHHYRCPACGIEVHRVQPFRGKSACLACCRKLNGGRYHDQFQFRRFTPAVQ